MAVNRVRFIVDVLYKSEDGKALSSPHLTMMANRIGSYARVCAPEGLETKIEVIHDEEHFHQHAHHHDARYEQCRVERNAAGDGLGPLE